MNLEPAFARSTDPETAHEAAAKVNMNYIGEKVVDIIVKHGPGTTEEFSQFSGIRLVSISPTMVKLERAGYVVRDGKRKNPSGRNAIVWRLRGPSDPPPPQGDEADHEQ
jgi:transcription initiation factor IIE alpha subunit